MSGKEFILTADGKQLFPLRAEITVPNERPWAEPFIDGNEWSCKANMLVAPIEWEYYHRRGLKYYFRSNHGDKIIAEMGEKVEDLKHYGPIDLNFGVE